MDILERSHMGALRVKKLKQEKKKMILVEAC